MKQTIIKCDCWKIAWAIAIAIVAITFLILI